MPIRRLVLLQAGVLLTCLTSLNSLGAETKRGASLIGTIVRSLDGKPVFGTQITLCTGVDFGKVLVNQDVPSCSQDIAHTRANASGRFKLNWPTENARLDGAALIISADDYVTKVINDKSLIDAIRSARLSVSLSLAPVVHALVVRPDGTPVAYAEYGLFVQDGPMFKVRHACCSDVDGKIDFGPDGLSTGKISVFAIEPTRPPRFALAEIVALPGSRHTVDLEVRSTLRIVDGTVVDSTGAPLAALVSAEPVVADGFDGFDRALVAIQGGQTDLAGKFEIRLSSTTSLILRLSTWTRGPGTPGADFGARPLTEITIAAGRTDAPVVLRSSPASVVTCSMFDEATPQSIDELGIWFLSGHEHWGHSGSCIYIRKNSESMAKDIELVRAR